MPFVKVKISWGPYPFKNDLAWHDIRTSQTPPQIRKQTFSFEYFSLLYPFPTQNSDQVFSVGHVTRGNLQATSSRQLTGNQFQAISNKKAIRIWFFKYLLGDSNTVIVWKYHPRATKVILLHALSSWLSLRLYPNCQLKLQLRLLLRVLLRTSYTPTHDDTEI